MYYIRVPYFRNLPNSSLLQSLLGSTRIYASKPLQSIKDPTNPRSPTSAQALDGLRVWGSGFRMLLLFVTFPGRLPKPGCNKGLRVRHYMGAIPKNPYIIPFDAWAPFIKEPIAYVGAA